MSKNHVNTNDFTHALKDDKIVHVDSVPNGISCECICPSCKRPLVAYNSPKNKNAHHFQHHNISECQN